jgi:transcription antitermination factor NusG
LYATALSGKATPQKSTPTERPWLGDELNRLDLRAIEGVWILVKIWQREECDVIRRLRALGAQVWTPLERVKRKYDRSYYVFERAVYPGFMFAAWRDADDWGLIFGTPGVVTRPGVRLGQADYSKPPDQGSIVNEMENMRETLCREPLAQSVNWFKRGDKVRVCEGPMMGIEGHIDLLKPGRVVVSIECMGMGGVPLEVGEHEIERC